MIFRAASIAAFFVDQLAQAPVVVQCAPSAGQDSLGERLLFASIPSIFALGIAASVFTGAVEENTKGGFSIKRRLNGENYSMNLQR